MTMWSNAPHCCVHAIWKYISNGINFYNWGLQGKPFFLLYIHLCQSSLLLYIWHFIFRNGDRAALFNEYRTSCLCFLCLDFSGSVGKVERGYSDAGFRDRRAILFFGYPSHSKIPLAVQRHNGFSITASTLRGHTGFLASSLCFFWIYSRSVPETLCLRTDAVLCLRTSLTCLFTNPYRYSFWSCYSSFFRCKVSMQPGTAESLGQWCSFTNLPLSGRRF